MEFKDLKRCALNQQRHDRAERNPARSLRNAFFLKRSTRRSLRE
ncbi:MAG: hypothetical protein NT050_15580 [Verrucomicrobia bacterium]|nr:hypothetical protein [Verrucomicrobiota bacterium]